MVERLLTIKKDELNNGNGKSNRLEQTQSFNTEDDESISPDDPQQLSETDSRIGKSGTPKSIVDDLKRGLLSIHSPSIDSVNDPDGLSPDTPLSEKAKRKKLRRETEQMNQEEAKRQVIKSQPWYTKVDFTKPLMVLALLFLIYIMWQKSDVWIPRLLTSNTRIRHIALANEQKLAEKDDSPPTSSSSPSSPSSSDNSSSTLSNQDEIANANDNNDNKNNNKNNDQVSISTNEESPPIPPPPKASAPQKLNIRIRRNKMSFSKERGGTKNRRLKHKTIDGDDDINVDDIDDNLDDIIDDNNSIESDDDEKSIESKQFILPSSIHSSKKHHHHHHQSGISREKNFKTLPSSKISLVVPSQEEVFQRLEKLIKSRHRNRDLLTELAQETGIKKSKLKQFIQKKDSSFMTLDTLISFLDSYDASLLIVPK